MQKSISFLKRFTFLILAIIVFIAAGVYYAFFERNSPQNIDGYYQQSLQKNINLQIDKSNDDLKKVVDLYNSLNPKSFNQIKSKSNFPYYIFKNSKLFYWSDNIYVPQYQNIKDISSSEIKKYNQQYGIFNVKKFNFKNDTLTVVSVINLFKHYKNENDYLQSGFNSDIFFLPPKKISDKPFESSKEILNADKKPILYFQLPGNEKILNSAIPKTTLGIVSLGILLLVFQLFTLLKKLLRQHKFGLAFLTLLLFGLSLRLVMLFTGIPFLFTKKELFNPSFFSGSFWSPTLGDTILNALFWLIFLFFVAIYYFRSRIFLHLLKSTAIVKSIISVLMVLLVLLFTALCSQKITAIYSNSMYQLGLSLSLSLNNLKLLTFLFYFLILGIFFITTHLAINIFLRIQRNTRSGFFHWLYGILLGFIIILFVGTPKYAYLVAGLYFLIVYYFKLSRYFYTLRFQTLMYFILACFCFSLISIEIIEKEEHKKSIFDKQTFANRYLADNDLLGEGLLDKFANSVKYDPEIVGSFRRNTLALESLKHLVKDNHLDLYFDKYDIGVLAFDATGQNLNDEEKEKNLEFYKNTYALPKYSTTLKNVFFLNETGKDFIKEYISFNDISEGNTKVGTIVLDLKLKDEHSESVYPELLLDKKFVQNPESKNYSYGIFDKNNKIIYSSGSFNYMMNFPKEMLSDEQIYNDGISYNDFFHLALKGQNGRTIVVSQEEKYYKTILSNFSFLFLLSILGISILLFAFGMIYGMGKFSMNFSTKIQLYLNAAFLLPLIIIIILTLSVVRTTLISIQEKSFLDNTKNIASTLQIHLENYQDGKTSKAFFENEINNLARNTKVDINLFGKDGKLWFSTRPLVYQYKLLSEHLNPEAYNKIIEEKENEILTNESLGTLNYKTVYLSVKGNGLNNFGIVGIPFFDAKTLLDMQVKEVVTIILIIFLFMFLLLLVLSYFASNQLTHPLKLIAQKLKKTNLDKLDESLSWKSDDEIGLLTKSYNNMLKKLDESKIALSQSEKQTAWREMAKQVAHEIKNPLTPMKLSIQQLQRTLPMDDPKSRDRIQRALNSLTEQIDNISEIANSFSEFAKMPVPRNERFDLVSVSQKTTDLYSQNNNIKIDFDTSDKEVFVNGDRLLVSRVITNLILNGIQSVPPIRQPQIKVKIYKNEEENYGIIEIKDNGSGIAEEVRKKVFIPNFSTKVGGSGLGLAMAKRGIEHAGGNIWFETEEGVGTTFFVDLPIS